MHPPTDGHGLANAGNARAFIIAERPKLNSSERTLLLNPDIAMRYLGVRRELLLALAEEYGNTTYHADNVALVGTHQHSGVHGYLESGWRVASAGKWQCE
jgi:neutral ceramidase